MRNKYLEFYNASFGSGEHCTKSWGLASFQAGAQSRQAEIEDLKKQLDNAIKTNEMLVAYKNELLDELQCVIKGETK